MNGGKRKTHGVGWCICCLLWMTLGTAVSAAEPTAGPLLLAEAASDSAKGGHVAGFESEHRPMPLRKYRLISGKPFGDMEAFVRHPNGQVADAQITRKKDDIFVSFPVPMGDGPMHGVHNLYVTDRKVEGDLLVVRTAKWHTIHHSCSWGHDAKYDENRIRAHTVSSVPLEISCQRFWDGNYHGKLQSGDRLTFSLLAHGRPLPDAQIRLISGKGWVKTECTGGDGTASMQLIRDYYPKRWKWFNRQHRERFTVVAEAAVQEPGIYQGQPYKRIRYISSVPWTYSPARSEYTSITHGLAVGFSTIIFSSLGVFFYRARRRRPYREVVFREKD